jgi:hypothetical protein
MTVIVEARPTNIEIADPMRAAIIVVDMQRLWVGWWHV